MKIAVIGGTGRIGSQVVRLLGEAGHEAVPHSTSSGVDLFTGAGLPGALASADVVVDLINSPTSDDSTPDFFRTTGRHLVDAAAAAGVGHVVLLSIVGVDQVPGVPYYRGKVAQEDALRAGPVPYSIVRAAQFYEFVDDVLSWTADATTVRLPATPLRPLAAADVSRAVAEVAAGAPLNGVRDVVGPEVFALDELGRVTLAARGDTRTVVTDPSAGLFATVPGDVLTGGPDAVRTTLTYREWLAG